ncbi:N-acetylglucosamine kinase-like BadF-type ATPase [Saccharopolyspora erythraea NRRL 2338]|uniref:N-acetylglucosamine kinase n=1 Tax=Saccharopolyspora erythraea TaxID=1836 RepID=UPI0004954DEB|nr:BadF/BadG/BcrA/BcrD ATPase family protein [Saccharopolyspora erythraea]PFG94697.1 N-acetylglucosamine kinase-like BadF-type ATPase [Saccharopolyspora erythraea NRRL 2338]QRK91424.1 ATPase [Saccharopolyspora erythraea]
MRAAVLAIDGGNSKTDVLLVDADGTVLAEVRGPGVSHQRVGITACLDALAGMATGAAAAAGLPTGPPFATHTAACLAGADLPREEEELREAVAARGWSESVVVENDTFALLRAGTLDGVGVAVVCGAGINCVGVAPDGRVSRFPAVGRISGDWGGGAFLAREALWWAVRAEDGRGPRTALLPAVVEHFGTRDIAEVVEALHFGELSGDALHALCPLLFAVAEAGDEVARDLVERQADEIGLLATVALRRLGMVDEPAVVVLGGGVLAGAGRGLVPGIQRRCAEAAPKVTVRLTEVAPVVGAGLLGLDRLGAAPEAKQRLARRR